MKILYFLPGTAIAGGVLAVFEHLNRLAKRGHDVRLISFYNKNIEVSWYPLDITPEPFQNIAEASQWADIIVATHYITAFFVNDLDVNAEKFYLVQNRESWFVSEESVEITSGEIKSKIGKFKKKFVKDYRTYIEKSYTLPLRHIATSSWLANFLRKEYKSKPLEIRYGINKNIFYPEPVYPVQKGKTRVLVETTNQRTKWKGLDTAKKALKNFKNIEIWTLSADDSIWEVDKHWKAPSQDEIRRIYSSCDILIKPSWFEGCFVPNTPILMADGTYKFIKDIEKGDRIQSKDTLQKVTRLKNIKESKQVYYINTLYSHKIRGITGNHKILVLSRKRTGTYKKNKKYGYNNNIRWERVNKIKKGDFVFIYKNSKILKQHCGRISFAKYIKRYSNNRSKMITTPFRVTRRFMEFLGLFIAEGSVGIRKRNLSRPNISLALSTRELDLRDFCRKVLSELLPQNKIAFKLQTNNRGGRSVNVRTSSRILGEWLSDNIGNGAVNKHIPPFVYQLPSSLVRALINGIINGDGCVSKNKWGYIKVSISTISKQLTYQIHWLLFHRLGILSSITTHRRSDSNRDEFVITIARNQNISWISKLRTQKERKLNKHFTLFIPDTKGTWVKVKEINSYKYNGYVYDIGLDNEHQYIADDILVHNCGLGPMQAMCTGTAVLTTDNKGSNDFAIHRKNALVVPPKDPKAMRVALKYLIEHPNFRKKLIQEGLETAKTFEWEPQIDKLEKEYEKYKFRIPKP